MDNQPPPDRTTNTSKPEPTGSFPHKPKTIHPTPHRQIIDELVRRSVYREPPKKPAPEVRP